MSADNPHGFWLGIGVAGIVSAAFWGAIALLVALVGGAWS